MLLLLALGPSLLPEFRDPEAGRLDLVSAALSLAAVLAVIYGLKQIAEDGLGWPAALSTLAGLAAGALFVRRQQTLADPLIDLRLFANRAFNASLAANTLAIFVAFGPFVFIAQYFQLVLGLSPLQAGLWTLPSSGGFIVGSMLAPVLVRRARTADVMAAGLVLAAIGLLVITQANGTAGLAAIVVGSVVLALGISPAITLSTDLIIGSAPPERAGAAAALSETGAELGGALGIAVLGSIGTAAYRARMADAVPAGVPLEAAEAAQATLGGAVVAAEQLPNQLGLALLDAARAAFTQSLELTAAIGAAVVLAAAVLVVAALRRAQPVSDHEPRPDHATAEACRVG
jgi:DHA2 family multidrug resistance protein-like MFS transporter